MDTTSGGEVIGNEKTWPDSLPKHLISKRKLRIASCGGIFCSILLIAVVPHYINISRKDYRQMVTVLSPQRYHTDLKYILFWGKMPLIEERQNMFVKQNCKYQNCFIAYNRSLLNHDIRNFDAIVFNVMNVVKENINTTIPRSPDQVYIFRSMEPATKKPVCDSKFDTFFNWTWTYRLDSDIPHPFFSIFKKGETERLGPSLGVQWPMPEAVPLTNADFLSMKRKKKAVAWILSSCTADKKDFEYFSVLQQELKKFNLSAHIYGPCAQSCPNNELKMCYKLVEEKYFFNYVIEEHDSKDFVGDKLLKALQFMTIPIVRGVSNYSRFLPPHSYLDAVQPSRLAANMNHLIAHPRHYMRFFDWKNHYSISETQRRDVCDLCTKLNEETKPKTRTDLRAWWNPNFDDACSVRSIPH